MLEFIDGGAADRIRVVLDEAARVRVEAARRLSGDRSPLLARANGLS